MLHSNRSSRLPPAHQGMKTRQGVGNVWAPFVPPLHPLDSGFRRNDDYSERGVWGDVGRHGSMAVAELR